MRSTRWAAPLLASAMAVLLGAQVGHTEIIADAGAEFSSTQGSNSWFWGYYDRTADLNDGGDGVYNADKFDRFSSSQWNFTFWDFSRLGSPFTEITSEYMTPNNWQGVEHYAVIRYRSEEAGKLNITGSMDLQSTFNSDGVIGRIFNEGTEIYAERTTGDALEINVDAFVSKGDYIDFVVDYGSEYQGTSADDATNYTFIIDYLGPGLVGDFNQNNELDIEDIDLLTEQSASGNNNGEYDISGDNQVDVDDIVQWVKDEKNTWIGDANLDGEFNSSDLVQVIGSGTYESQFLPGVWSTGDFNGDGRTNSSDLVMAIGDGGYENGPRAAVAAVPEPSSVLLLLSSFFGLAVFRRKS